MSDVSALETAKTDPEAPVAAPEEQPREPLPYEEMEKRYRALGRDVSAQRREIRELREALLRGPTPTPAQQDALDEGPDPDVDPIGFIKFARSYMNQVRRNEIESEKQQQAQGQQRAAVEQISRSMREYESDFRSDHPDYDQAAAHFRDARVKELQEEGIGGQDLNAALQQELINTVARSIRAGKDPADVIYKLAKNRGFGVDAGDKKLDTITRATAAGKSLSNAGGSRGNQELTVEYVNTLKGKDFLEGVAKLRAQAKEAKDFR